MTRCLWVLALVLASCVDASVGRNDAPGDVDVVDNAPPQLTLGPPLPPSGIRGLSHVEVAVAVSDANGDATTVAFEYERDGVWHAATAAPTSTPDVFVWDMLTDLPSTVFADVTVVSLRADARLRATATDAVGAVSETLTTAPFAVGDTPPSITLDAIEGTQKGNVRVPILLLDASADPADVQLEFCLAQCETETSWKRGAIAGPSTELPSNRAHVILWDSAAAAIADRTAPQGVGATAVANVSLRLRASDRVDGSTTVWGDPVVGTLASLRNQSAPRIVSASARRGILSTGNSPVAITYVVSDAEGDTVDLLCEYAHGDGVWLPCKEARLPESEGAYDLETSLAGLVHTFVWDPSTGPEAPTLQVALSVSDGINAPEAPVLIALAEGMGWPGDVGFEDQGSGSGAVDTGSYTYDCTAWGGGVLTYKIATGDIDGDGREDMVVRGSNPGDTNLEGWRSRGTGNINAPRTFADGGSNATEVAVCDFDGDGLDDIAVGNSAFESVNVLKSNGDGTFAAGVTVTLSGSKALTLAVGHFDADNFCDLAIGGTGVVILRGQAASPYLDSDGAIDVGTPKDIAVGDFNRDGLDDFATINTGNDLSLQLSSGIGFSANGSFALGATLRELELADFDQDGHLDVALAITAPQALIRIYRGTADDRVDPAFAAEFSLSNPPVALTVGDVTTDGVPDFAVVMNTFAGAKLAKLYVSTGSPELSFHPPINIAPVVTAQCPNNLYRDPMDIAFIDVGMDPPSAALDTYVHLDGIPDLVLSDGGAERRMTPFFAKDQWVAQTTSFRSAVAQDVAGDLTVLAIGDLDHDGFTDVVCGTENEVTWLRNLGTTTVGQRVFEPARALDIVATIIAVGDIDGDGDDDIVGASSLNETVSAYLQNAGAFAPAGTATLSEKTVWIGLGEVTGDSHVDIVAISVDNQVHVLSGGGDGTFVPSFSAALSGEARAPLLADFTHDGLLDLAFAYDADVFVHPGSGAGAFGAAIGVAFHAGSPIQGLAAADINRDGNTDLLISGDDVDAITPSKQVARILMGAGDATFIAGPGFIAPGPNDNGRSAALADIDGNGLTDIVFAVDDDDGVQGAIVASFGTAAPTAYSQPAYLARGAASSQVLLADIDGDRTLDVVHGSPQSDHLRVELATDGRWRSSSRKFGSRDVHAVGIAEPLALDRFGRARHNDTITVRRYRGRDFREALDRSKVARPAVPLRALTDPWSYDGDVFFKRTSLGLALTPRFGAGLSVAAGRYLVIDLPVLETFATVDANKVHVYRWADTWTKLVASGSGERYVVANGRIRIYAEKLGVFAAFVEP